MPTQARSKQVQSRQAQGAPVLYDVTVLKGGWDQITPTLALAPSYLKDVSNFEVAPVGGGGYSRIAGYERYDGRPSPSKAFYTLLQIISFENTPTLGQTLTGQTSGATGVIVALGPNYLILTKIVGSFTTSEVVKVGATTIGTTTPTTTTITPLLNAQYIQAAADNYRLDIGQVPGSGPVRGVFGYTKAGVDHVYAFRNNVGGTAKLLYEDSAAGWVLVPFFNEISFTAGGAGVPADESTLQQGGVTATIKRVVWQSGSWTGSTAAGRFIITNPVGGNFAAGAATAGGVAVTLSGAQTVIALSPGGKLSADLANFSGQANTIRVYGCDGVQRGFEFDGTTYVPITTGTTPDIPSRVKAHQNQLFFAFRSSAIHSGPGAPYKWTAADGSSEIAVGDTVTDFMTQPGSQTTAALSIVTISNTHMLYGTGVANWNRVPFNTGIGGIERTAQQLNQSYWMDAPGVVNLYTTLNYGNFLQSTMTNNIKTFILEKNEKVADSTICRQKSSYRIFFNDTTALYMTVVNGKYFGSTRVEFADSMFMVWEGRRKNGFEVIYAAAENSGYVYQMEVGSSFDGAVINAFITLNWNFMKSPRLHKRYRRASIEVQGNFYAELSFGYALGYNSTEVPQPTTVTYPTNFSAPVWDSFVWDSFTWDGNTLSPTEVRVSGTAENIQTIVRSGTNYIHPYTLNSIIYHYSFRRGIR